jgi:hypothetical protein
MALPHNTITPIPNNEPDAVPSLWNTRYVEIDENFAAADARITSTEQELTGARGHYGALGQRVDDIESRVGTTEPDYQEAMHFELRRQLELLALADMEINKTRRMRIQQGLVGLVNRGVQYGCAVSRSDTPARVLNISAGQFFINGRLYAIQDRNDDASVPPNTTNEAKTCIAYLRLNGGIVDFDCSQLGDREPADAVALYLLTVPPGNTEKDDPRIANVKITDIRRLEPDYPILLSSPHHATVPLAAPLPDSGYQVALEVVSGGVRADHLGIVQAGNGLRIILRHSADDVVVRYTIIHMGA